MHGTQLMDRKPKSRRRSQDERESTDPNDGFATGCGIFVPTSFP
jgi:hypothetical protein